MLFSRYKQICNGFIFQHKVHCVVNWGDPLDTTSAFRPEYAALAKVRISLDCQTVLMTGTMTEVMFDRVIKLMDLKPKQLKEVSKICARYERELR